MKKIIPLKKLGQNFLQDTNIAKKIIGLLGDINDKIIYEIGPGMGALTEHLIKANANLICIDVDERAVNYLKEKFNDAKNIKIICDDIRNIKIPITENPISIIGNVPYNLTNEILF
jgi:16S rRNA (adenine1518-N6/adenine1519-N6)-dimethyltransferase